MSPPDGSQTGPSDRPENAPAIHRRRFLALGAGTATAMLAGCAGDGGLMPGDGSSPGGSDPAMGTFRLLISDQPVAIDEFDELNVTFDRARIFVAVSDDEDDEDDTETRSPAATEPSPETEETADEVEEADGEAEDGEENFFVIDLEGATVDLTQVVGEKALEVFDGEFPAGRYAKIELYAADVEGIVDGEPVEVKIPSGKLQIVKPFEIEAGETVSFVFDINVVKKGQANGYNLLPVIAKSGVAGEDVEVEEVDDEGTDSPESTEDDEG